MVKFIDKNRKSEYYNDELLVRCSCGCGILAFRTILYETNLGNMLGLELFYYRSDLFTNKHNYEWYKKGAYCHLVDPKILINLYGLASGQINNGQGYLQSETGTFLGIDTSKQHDHLVLQLLPNEKAIKKLIKTSPEKQDKLMIWQVSFEQAETEKIIEFIRKKFSKLLENITYKNSEDEEADDDPEVEEVDSDN